MRGRLIVVTACLLLAAALAVAACGGSSKKDKTATASSSKTSGLVSAGPSAQATRTGSRSPSAGQTAQSQATAGTTVLNSQGTPVAVPTIPPEFAPSTPIGGAATAPPDATAVPTATVKAPPLPSIVPDSSPPAVPSVPAAFIISAPATAAGEFAVTVALTGAVPPWKGYGIEIQYDPNVVVAEDSTQMGNLFDDPGNAFCTPTAITPDGTATYGCVRIGSETLQSVGVAAVFHFKTVGKGVTQLHLVTYAENGPAATILLDSESNSLQVGTVDAVVTVP